MAGQQTRGSRTAGNAIGDGRELASDRRARRAGAAERDAPFKAAYEAGRRGGDPAEHQTSDATFAAYQDGQRAAKAEARGARVDQLRGDAGRTASSLGSDGAGFLLGLLAYALLANYLRGGPTAVRAWLAAKFLNRTSSNPGVTRPSSPTPNTAQPAQAIRVGQ